MTLKTICLLRASVAVCMAALSLWASAVTVAQTAHAHDPGSSHNSTSNT